MVVAPYAARHGGLQVGVHRLAVSAEMLLHRHVARIFARGIARPIEGHDLIIEIEVADLLALMVHMPDDEVKVFLIGAA